jgi:hypothetical protein
VKVLPYLPSSPALETLKCSVREYLARIIAFDVARASQGMISEHSQLQQYLNNYALTSTTSGMYGVFV